MSDSHSHKKDSKKDHSKKKDDSKKERKDSHGASDGSDDENEPTISQDIVVTKYNMAADIVNAVLKELMGKCIPGQSIAELCDLGDKQLTELTSKVFKKEKEVKKGIAFPTCISVNHCICHFSPLRSDPDVQLKESDVVKIDLGAHIDGFIATAAQTVVVGATKDNKVTGKKADAIVAAYNGMELAMRMLRPGQHKNMEVTDAITKLVTAYDCKPIENMLSHQLTRNKIDGDKQIIQNPVEKSRQDIEKCDFEQHEVFAVDVLVSTGEGKARDADTRTTVYKKEDIVYQLKMKASRNFFSDADKRFGCMPFTLRAFEEETKAKMGVTECANHGLMKPYQVLWEREGEFVSQFKSTVLIMPNGLHKITGFPLDIDVYQSERKLEDEKLSQILLSSLKPSKKKANKKKGDASEKKPISEQNGAAEVKA